MGLNDYPQNVNDKMTMTIYDNVGWFRYAFALPPLCLRFDSTLEVDTRRGQNGSTAYHRRTHMFVGKNRRLSQRRNNCAVIGLHDLNC